MKVLPVLLFVTCTAHAEEAPVLVADSMEAVLKLDPEELAGKLGNPSEAGRDQAARIWAAAKRVETEGKLARRSVRRVMALDQLRYVLDGWQDLQLEIVSLERGGGTMWGHLSWRNDASLEEFLAGMTESMLVEGSEPDGEVTKAVDALLADAGKWLARAGRKDESGTGREEWVTSIRGRLGEFRKELLCALGLLSGRKEVDEVLEFCREAMEVGKLGEG